jgi:cation:H+ antiporter
MEMLLACGVFALSAAEIVFAGTKSTRYGNRIADETGPDGLWIGVVLMASATSRPEILTGMSPAWMNEPDLAADDLIGSKMAIMLILGIIDLLHRG